MYSVTKKLHVHYLSAFMQYVHLFGHKHAVFSLNRDKNLFAAFTNLIILKIIISRDLSLHW